MELGLKGKVAIVTGAGSQIGFGKAIALTLAGEGCDIVVADIDLEGAKQTAGDVEVLGRKAIAIKTDITSNAEVNEMVNAALKEFGKIDILVNNAGAGKPPKSFDEYTEADFNFDIDINLKGMLYCTRVVFNHMTSRKSGKIISISSGAGKVGRQGIPSYSAAKAGVIAATQSLAAELAPYGINVNAVAPGLAMTGFIGDTPQEFIDNVAKESPLGRLTVPQDIANMVAFLASDVSRTSSDKPSV